MSKSHVAVTWDIKFNSSVIPVRQVKGISTNDDPNKTTKDFTTEDLVPNLWVKAHLKHTSTSLKWARIIHCGSKNEATTAMLNLGPQNSPNSSPAASPEASNAAPAMLNFSFHSGSAASHYVGNLDPEDDSSNSCHDHVFDRADLDLAGTVRKALRAANDIAGDSTQSGPAVPSHHNPFNNFHGDSVAGHLDQIISSQQQLLQNQVLILQKIAALEKGRSVSESATSSSLEIYEGPQASQVEIAFYPTNSVIPTTSAPVNEAPHNANNMREFVINTSATINSNPKSYRRVDFQELLRQASPDIGSDPPPSPLQQPPSPQQPLAAPQQPLPVLQQPLPAPQQPQDPPQQQLAAPQQPMAAPQQPLGALLQPLAAPQQPLGPPQQPLGGPQQPLAAPQQPLAPPQQPQAAPPQPLAAPQQPLAPPQQPMAAPQQPQAAPQQPLAPPQQPMAAPQQPQAAPPQPLAAPQQPLAPPQQPMAAPQQPQAAPQQPLAPPQQPMAAPQQPQAAPQQPLAPPQQPLGAPQQPLAAQQPLHALQQPFPAPQMMGPFVPNISLADIDTIFAQSASRKNFATRLARRIYSREERVGRNCNGKRGKLPLCPEKLAYIYHLVMGKNPRVAGEEANHILWRKCLSAIDLDGRQRYQE